MVKKYYIDTITLIWYESVYNKLIKITYKLQEWFINTLFIPNFLCVTDTVNWIITLSHPVYHL